MLITIKTRGEMDATVERFVNAVMRINQRYVSIQLGLVAGEELNVYEYWGTKANRSISFSSAPVENLKRIVRERTGFDADIKF